MAVNHSHIVPAGYLRQFALPDEQIKIVLTATGETVPARTTVRNAGVRGGGHYNFETADGAINDDFETKTLQGIEDKAIPIFREISERWPLSGEDKVNLATFIGLQVVRGPRWFAWHDQFTQANLDEYRRQGAFEPKPQHGDASEEEIYRANLDFFGSAQQRLKKMAFLGAKVGCAIGSMCWSLIDFRRPVLATSDHPVAVWPMTDGGRINQPTEPAEVGIRNFLEVRLPVSASKALLMTWRDLPDDPEPITGKSHHAVNLNAFTVAEAEKQWFFMPGTIRPRIRDGSWLPISSELIGGYSAAAANRAEVYGTAIDDLQGRVGDESLMVEIHYIPQEARAALLKGRDK